MLQSSRQRGRGFFTQRSRDLGFNARGGSGGGNSAPAFSPLDLGSKFKLWIDGDFLEQTTGTIDRALDQSGFGFHMGQSTLAAKPSAIAADANGHNVIDFNGTTHFLTGTAISNILAADAYVSWIVIRTDALHNSASTLLNASPWADAGAFVGLHLRNDSPTARLFNFDANGGTADEVQTAYAIVSGTYSLVRCRHEGGQIFIKHGASAESAGVTNGNTSNVAGLFRIGRSGGATTLYDGKIAAVLFVSGTCTADELTNVDAYLTSKYAL